MPQPVLRISQSSFGDDAFFLLTPNTKNRIHSQFNNLEMIRMVCPAPEAMMNPTDALRHRITDGDSIRIYNDRGAVVVRVRLDAGLRSGCVSLTNGWWAVDGGQVNFTSAARETDMGHGAAFHDNIVRVARTDT